MDRTVNNSYQYKVHTFGCKVNTYDSGLIQKNLKASGFSLSEEPRIHIFNTCAVTAEATKEAVKLVRRLRVKDPFCTVVVTGCGAQVDTGFFEEIAGVDLVVANSHKSQLPSILEQYFKGNIKEKVFKSNIFKKEELEAEGGEEAHHTRAFVKIQDGCNSFCTYCIIPYARGKSRSIRTQEIVDKVNHLYDSGTREVVLTGVHIGDYEDHILGQTKVMEDLIEAVLQKTKMPRIRLSSLEPVEVSDRLLDIYSDTRMCPHFHMSIQSANDQVLEKMKRKYTQKDVITSLEKVAARVKNVFIGMDVITGFPNESFEYFEDTYLTLAGLPWTRIHVFPYSERPGTRAVSMTETVPLQERQHRAQRLRELSSHRYEEEGRKQIGQIKKSLLLKNATKSQAVTDNYWSVLLASELNEKNKSGEEVLVCITDFVSPQGSRMDGYLQGELVL